VTLEQKAANVALLARVVMGWPLHEWEERGKFWICRICSRSVLDWEKSPLGPCPPEGHLDDWDPYVSIADAMEVLDRCEWFDLEKRIPYVCDIWVSGRVARFHGEGQTIQDAICSACLEWARAQGERT